MGPRLSPPSETFRFLVRRCDGCCQLIHPEDLSIVDGEPMCIRCAANVLVTDAEISAFVAALTRESNTLADSFLFQLPEDS